LATHETLKIEDAFLQQKPMFAIPQQIASPPAPTAQLPLFVPAVQPQVTLTGLRLDGGAFSPVAAPVPSLPIQQPLPVAPIQAHADLFQMIQKTISPPLVSAASSPPLQFLSTVNFLPPVSIADFGAQTALPQLSCLPQISYRELEQFLMFRHQQKLNFQ
jgi:hypothetical protein